MLVIFLAQSEMIIPKHFKTCSVIVNALLHCYYRTTTQHNIIRNGKLNFQSVSSIITATALKVLKVVFGLKVVLRFPYLEDGT